MYTKDYTINSRNTIFDDTTVVPAMSDSEVIYCLLL